MTKRYHVTRLGIEGTGHARGTFTDQRVDVEIQDVFLETFQPPTMLPTNGKVAMRILDFGPKRCSAAQPAESTSSSSSSSDNHPVFISAHDRPNFVSLICDRHCLPHGPSDGS